MTGEFPLIIGLIFDLFLGKPYVCLQNTWNMEWIAWDNIMFNNVII